MLSQGLVQVYTGKTKQINLSHIGLSLRATGQNLRTFVMGFFPHPFIDIEDRALSFLEPYVRIERLSLPSALYDKTLHGRETDSIRVFDCSKLNFPLLTGRDGYKIKLYSVLSAKQSGANVKLYRLCYGKSY